MNILPLFLKSRNVSSWTCFAVYPSSFLFFFSLFFIFLPGKAFAQAPACYTFQEESSLCIGPGQTGNLCQISGQYYCSGHTTIPTTSPHPNHDCWSCGSGPTQEKLSCSSLAGPPNEGASCQSLGYQVVDCGDPNGVVQCVSIYSDGCRSCAVPQCPVGTQPAYNKCVAPITCSVTTSATGTTTGQGSTAIGSNQDPVGYTTAEWRLVNLNDGSSQVVGYTIIDSSGNSSNNFTNLQPSTGYRVEVTYRDPDGPRPDVSCSPANFTTWTPGQQTTQMTGSLIPTYSSIFPGGTVKWELANNPAGATATWRGTNPDGSQVNGPVVGYSNTTSWTGTYTYNDSGSYQRYVQIKDSGGNTKCTTDTSQVYVQAQPPPQLETCSAGGQTGYCGNSSKQFPQNYQVNCGSGTLTYASSGDPSCSGNYPYCYICLAPQQATDTCPDESGTPTGGCGDSGYGLLGQCSGGVSACSDGTASSV